MPTDTGHSQDGGYYSKAGNYSEAICRNLFVLLPNHSISIYLERTIPMTNQPSFLTRPEGETYDELPSGEGIGLLSNIGHVKTVRRWRVWVSADTAHSGEYPELPNPVPASPPPLFLAGDFKKADTWTKTYQGERTFAKGVYLSTMPIDSVTNMPDEVRAKFTSPFIQIDVPTDRLGTNYADAEARGGKYGQGFHLVTIPSLFDAYARMAGWWEKPLFDPSLCRRFEERVVGEDGAEEYLPLADIPAEVFHALAEQRKTVWAALGESEKNWRETATDKVQSAKLKELIDNLIIHQWNGYVRMARVYNPAPSSFYVGGEDGKTPKRNFCQAFLEFFPGEREAIEAGVKELNERAGTASNGASVPSLFGQLSIVAQETYGDEATLNSVIPDIKGDNRPAPVVAKEYGVTKEDVVLVRGK